MIKTKKISASNAVGRSGLKFTPFYEATAALGPRRRTVLNAATGHLNKFW